MGPKPAYRHTVENSIHLAPGWTGQGLGGALLEALLTRLFPKSRTADDRRDRRHRRLGRAARRCGFTDVSRLAAIGYKHDRWIDTLLMQRTLGRTAADTTDLNQ
ncbi:hypothetical protein ABZ488_34205 [Streptomyces griseus]|uniref:hypothetical protein n=1 Tax=Streptomyces griseus TaxID=1911 RepID=UPI0033CC6209